ncbi:MAG: hypothetical protein R3E68_06060 [Burkholderiaceae bacterium]
MNAKRFQRVMHRELDTLRREGLLSAQQHSALSALYPLNRWDWSSLGRWFLFFGAISAAAGLYILGAKLFEPTLGMLAGALGLLIPVIFLAGHSLGKRRLVWTSRSLQLLGGIAIIGLTFTLGILFSSGSGNWPALLLIDLCLLLPLAYGLRNALLLVLSMVVFFTWFGGITGYLSGWGAYFFGMNYPVRFLLAGLAMIVLGLLHRSAEATVLRLYDGFFKVWLSGGMFFAEMALWLTSLFGNYGGISIWHRGSGTELLMFNLLWVVFNLAALVAGSRYGLRMLRLCDDVPDHPGLYAVLQICRRATGRGIRDLCCRRRHARPGCLSGKQKAGPANADRPPCLGLPETW